MAPQFFILITKEKSTKPHESSRNCFLGKNIITPSQNNIHETSLNFTKSFLCKNHITPSPQQLVVLLTCCLVVFSFGRSGEAVGLSAISLLPMLAKDAAPIPNALGDALN
ncbi:MAG: hypothetical protein J6R32_06575 [Bacteroidales bacterium]|nr:hypothetical protein [Bacteroidales bacterium]